MNAQVAIQNLLQAKLSEAQSLNERFSLRAFSRKLGLHPGAVSGILNGKRNVSEKLARRLADKMMLDPQERAELLSKFQSTKILRRVSNEPGAEVEMTDEYRKISAAQFKVTADWEHFAVLSLIKTADFKNDAKWIAERLAITTSRAREVIDRLIQVGMLTLDENLNLQRTSPKFRTTDDVADVSLRRSHEQTLELAKASLHRDDVSLRDHTWLTFAIDPKKIGIAKEAIRRFQDEFATLVESGTRTEVYRFSMQLFPLTKVSKTENENEKLKY